MKIRFLIIFSLILSANAALVFAQANVIKILYADGGSKDLKDLLEKILELEN